MSNTKIYFKQGGDELVVGAGATITIEDGATATGIVETAAWSTMTGKPAVIAAGADKAAARAAIDAADVAHDHAIDAHEDSGLLAAADLQALAQALSARIKTLEDAALAAQG